MSKDWVVCWQRWDEEADEWGETKGKQYSRYGDAIKFAQKMEDADWWVTIDYHGARPLKYTNVKTKEEYIFWCDDMVHPHSLPDWMK